MKGVQGELFESEPDDGGSEGGGEGGMPLGTTELLAELDRWAEAGWIRRLDSAFARFMVELHAEASPVVVMASAMVAHMEGRGHACLDLDALVASSKDMLAFDDEPQASADEVLRRLPDDAAAWAATLVDSPLVALADACWATSTTGNARPLVLMGHKVYLRRYWRHESRVARQVAMRSAAGAAGVAGDAAGSEPRIDAVRVRQILDRLFDSAPAGRAGASAASSTASSEVASGPRSAALSATDAASPDWQRIACALALRSPLSIITGGPGTGKTYTVARLLALILAMAADADRVRVALAAPTGKAAARLKQSIDAALGELEARVGGALDIRDLASHIGAARTLHSLLGVRRGSRHFRHDASDPLNIDVLIVDEASMVHLEMMDALLAALPAHARVVLLGDKDQLASVEAGAVLGDLCRGAAEGGYVEETAAYVLAATGQTIPKRFLHQAREGEGAPSTLLQAIAMLRTSRRFGGPIGKLANAVNEGDPDAALSVLRDEEQREVRWVADAAPSAIVALAAAETVSVRPGAGSGTTAAMPAPASHRRYLELLRDAAGDSQEQLARQVLDAFERFRVLCAVRDGDFGVDAMNRGIEQELREAGLLKRGSGEWYEGRPVLVTRNDHAVGVFNGDVGIALAPPGGGSLRVYFTEGDSVRSVMASRLTDVETAFAMTVHKSQGSEFEHTVLVLPEHASRVLSRELVYTGITRARKAFTLVTPAGDAFRQALTQRTMRASGLPEMLAAEEARRRPA